MGENVADYVAALRKLTRHCQFGAYLPEALRDRLVCGLRSEEQQKRLLAEHDLTFNKALSHSTEHGSCGQRCPHLTKGRGTNSSSGFINTVAGM